MDGCNYQITWHFDGTPEVMENAVRLPLVCVRRRRGTLRQRAGVRCHAFLKGEDSLSLAWAGPEPALAVGSDGAVRELPETGAKRDASGSPLDAVIGSIGGSAATLS